MNPYNLLDVVPAAGLTLKHTNDRYSMSNQYHQPTIHQPRTDSNPVFFHCERWTVKGKDCASAWHFFKETIYWMDE